MWTDEAIEMYSAKLTATEQSVLRAVSLGYGLEDTLDWLCLHEPDVDLDYARAFLETVLHPDKRVPLEA